MKNSRISKFIVLTVAVVSIALLIFARPSNRDVIATIDYMSSGCFGSQKSKLILKNMDGKVVAILVEQDDQPLENILDDSHLEKFNTFMKELSELREDGGCTTVDWYKVNYKGVVSKKKHAGCDWNGFYVLTRSIFDIASD